jgi:hypothetical protein
VSLSITAERLGGEAGFIAACFHLARGVGEGVDVTNGLNPAPLSAIASAPLGSEAGSSCKEDLKNGTPNR